MNTKELSVECSLENFTRNLSKIEIETSDGNFPVIYVNILVFISISTKDLNDFYKIYIPYLAEKVEKNKFYMKKIEIENSAVGYNISMELIEYKSGIIQNFDFYYEKLKEII